MPFVLGQLIYTSFPGIGFRVLTSAQVPSSIQQAFIEQLVYKHWDSYSSPKLGYQAVYLHQATPRDSLFGWLYNDGLDDAGRSHIPYFFCYYLAEQLHTVRLENIFTCLHRGPVALVDRQTLPASLETVGVPDLWSYQPARAGLAIPSNMRDRSHLTLEQGKLLDLFVPINQEETVTELNGQIDKQQEAHPSINPHKLRAADLNADTTAIEAEILKPDQAYRDQLQPYKQAFLQEPQHKPPLSNSTLKQRQPGLPPAGDIAPAEDQGTRQRASQSLEIGATRTSVSSGSEAIRQVKPPKAPEVTNQAKTPASTEAALSQGRQLPTVKVALLVGVSHYGTGFDSLPGALKDVEAMKRVLQHPEIGGFAEVRTLLNPDCQVMEEAIEALFSECQRDKLVLFYFSGHAIKDSNGKLYLATSITRRNGREKLVKSSVVPASFVREAMNESRSQQQLMILDCCFSEVSTVGAAVEADKGESYAQEMAWSNQKASSVNVNSQLGGEGRVILASSTSTPSFFEQNESGLSVYTHHLIEGLETGIADLDNDGAIAIEELHEYAGRKVQIATPALQPRIYRTGNYGQIILAQAPFDDPKHRYRKEVERCANHGEISVVNRSILGVLRDSLGLLPEEATAIEAGVLQPYREYQRKLQRYVRGFVKAIHHESPIGDDTRDGLKGFQQILGLTDADIAPIEAQVTRQRESFPSTDFVESTRTQKTIPLDGAIKPVKQPNKVATTQAATPTFTQTTTSLWNRSIHPASILVSRSSKLLIGIATALALTGVIYKLLATPTSPSTSLAKPKLTSAPKPLSSSAPIPLTTASPQPSPKSVSELSPFVPSPPMSMPVPSSIPEPASSVPAPLPTSVPVSKPMSPKPTAVSKPNPTPPVTAATTLPSKPKALSRPQPQPAVSRKPRPRSAAAEPPPTSVSEPPPTSAPKTTLSAPDSPPTSWSEPPPTSAPGSNL